MRAFGTGCLLLLAQVFAASAHAACNAPTGRFFVDRDDTYKLDWVITGDTRWCSASYNAFGTASFSGMKVAVPPKHGHLGPHGDYGTISFRYNVKPGFKGSDFFAIQVCGESRGRKGCARIEYSVTVK